MVDDHKSNVFFVIITAASVLLRIKDEPLNKLLSNRLILFVPGILLILGVFSPPSLSGEAEKEPVQIDEEIPDLIEKADLYFAHIHQDISGLKKAAHLYETVLHKQPDHQEAHWKLSEILFVSAMETGEKSAQKEFYKQSIEHAEQVLQADPLCVPALFYSGYAHISLADTAGMIGAVSLLKKGKKELTRTMEYAPGNRFGILAACVLSQINTDVPWPLKDLKEAEKLARQAVAWDPVLTLARVQLATVFRHQKKYEAARVEARRCLAITSPTYISDAVLWDWPAARSILEKTDQ